MQTGVKSFPLNSCVQISSFHSKSRNMIYLLKLQLGCRPVAGVQYTFTHKQYTDRHKTNNKQNNSNIFGRVLAVPRLCELYPDICLRTEEKARKSLSQDSRRVPAGTTKIYKHTIRISRSQWPSGLRRRSAAARLLRLWVRIPPGAWMFVCCECCVLSGRGLCDELITRPEESYRLWCVVVCDLETSWMGRPWPTGGCRAKNKQTIRIHRHNNKNT